MRGCLGASELATQRCLLHLGQNIVRQRPKNQMTAVLIRQANDSQGLVVGSAGYGGGGGYQGGGGEFQAASVVTCLLVVT